MLDAVLEDGRLAIEAVTGASAGAMNAVVMVEGWVNGGIDGARSQLETFWRKASVGSARHRCNADCFASCWATGATSPG